ncbi:hypothetical protein TSUD_194710 [Trifolium subterraneum]|uniref:Uncharacterized protein n=1 Tax=Trifolium subterraneum TaxID=3900 RepID=A0A2Z6P399_TRISU|nr:hypothetical protein TSUD_194710 [Trifolium subterraneum]
MKENVTTIVFRLICRDYPINHCRFRSISLLIPKELLLIEYMEILYMNSNEIRRNMEEYLSYGTSSQVTYWFTINYNYRVIWKSFKT